MNQERISTSSKSERPKRTSASKTQRRIKKYTRIILDTKAEERNSNRRLQPGNRKSHTTTRRRTVFPRLSRGRRIRISPRTASNRRNARLHVPTPNLSSITYVPETPERMEETETGVTTIGSSSSNSNGLEAAARAVPSMLLQLEAERRSSKDAIAANENAEHREIARIVGIMLAQLQRIGDLVHG